VTARADGPRRTPVMEQFFRAKDQHPDAILFFRMGDFYEMFFEDAVLASELLDITLTSRSKAADGDPIPMAGVPHHAATGYITRLLEKGQRVAICEQMEDPSKCKGVVPREVVRVITPGLVLDPDALDARAHNYLVALVEDPAGWGMASLELSTAEARACTLGDEPGMLAELSRLDPREILLVASPEATARVHDAIARTMPRTCLREIDRTRDDPAPVLARVVGEIAAADALAMRTVVTEMPPDFSRLIPSYASETFEPGTMSSRPSGHRTHALCPPS